MSHSKQTKRNYSIYIEKWAPSNKKYIHTCAVCGHQGYSPAIEQEDFRDKVAYRELTKILCKIQLDELGRCEDCARIMERRYLQ